MLQCVFVCCRLLHRVELRRSDRWFPTVHDEVPPCIVLCFGMKQFVAVCIYVFCADWKDGLLTVDEDVPTCVAVQWCCTVMKFVGVCCISHICVAACCSAIVRLLLMQRSPLCVLCPCVFCSSVCHGAFFFFFWVLLSLSFFLSAGAQVCEHVRVSVCV